MRSRPRAASRLLACLLAGTATAGGAAEAAPTVLSSRADPGPCAPAERRPDETRDRHAGCTAPPLARRPPGERRVDIRQPARASAPLPATTLGERPPDGNPDPFVALGARSPFCQRPALRARPGCRLAGSITHSFPASNYGLDIQIDTGVTRIEDNLLAALQAVAALVWLGLVYALKGTLLALEWAFSLDLLNEAMRGVRGALRELHTRVLGTPWFMAAIAVAGLWGIWNGLVERRTIQTIGGLAATLGLMLVALALISNPTGTVGHASKLANEGALGLMSAASSGRLERPEEGFARASERLFDALVLRPWCALQFGDVSWCTRPRAHGLTNAELWLVFPAEGKERQALYKLTKGEDPTSGGFLDDVGGFVRDALRLGHPGLGGALGALEALRTQPGAKLPDEIGELVREEPARVAMQEKGASFTRIALLALIAFGLVGAIGLLLYLALKLILAGLLALILLLLAPAMLLAPAFGESGRATFLAWLKRLAGALVAKLVYALLLAVVVVAAAALAALEIGWFGTWLLQSALWWGVLLKRKELTGFLSVGHEGERDGPSRSLRLYQQARAGQAVAAGIGVLAAAPGRKAASALSVGRLRRAETRAAGASLAGREALDETAERARALEFDRARALVATRPALENERRALARALRGYDDELVEARAAGQAPRPPRDDELKLLAERERVERALEAPALRQAEASVREAERALAREGRLTSESERAAWREQRRRDIREGLEPDHERNLRAAGIDPLDYRRSSPEAQAELRERSRAQIEHDRRLLAALPEDGRKPTAAETAHATSALDPDELRRRTAEQRSSWQHERSLRRRRQHLYRR
jgi:hypothetical protein